MQCSPNELALKQSLVEGLMQGIKDELAARCPPGTRLHISTSTRLQRNVKRFIWAGFALGLVTSILGADPVPEYVATQCKGVGAVQVWSNEIGALTSLGCKDIERVK